MNSDASTPLLIPGLTCWKTVRAQRLAVIQDAGPTFAAMAEAMESARRTIFIIGWDIDSRTALRPERPVSDGGEATAGKSGTPLLPFLLGCLARQPELQIFILIWDFAIIYAFEREPLPRQQFGKVHPRLHFALADDHGSGGSHHQKLVVVDDEMAFTGGVDLTVHRWDTPEHLPRDDRRLDGEGHEYPPFHDVHAAVAGPAAAALGALARARWSGAGRRRGRVPTLVDPGTTSIWPRSLTVDARDLDIALARTLVSADQPPVLEIAALTERMIAAASRRIYAENQYLTSPLVARALGERLAQPGGPEVVLVLPAVESGWMEQGSMGVLRDKALAHLRRQDVEGRLRVLSPSVRDGQAEVPIALHSKVLVIDERIAKIGSANFSSRSLGLDSECDLVIDASLDPTRAALVASVRDRLLAEHLGLDVSEVARRLAADGPSLLELVDRQAPDGARRLVPITHTSEGAFDFTVLDGAMVDPAEPWSVDGLLERAVPVPLRRRLARQWLRPVLTAAALLLAWTLLRRGPLREWQIGATALEVANELASRPAGPVLAFIAVAVASSLFVPITLLVTATLTVFGLWPGVPVAWTGAVVGATLSHAIGGRWGQRVPAMFPARFSATVRRFLGKSPFWSVVLMRVLPVGNFGVLNLLAGAFKIPRRSFVFGNALGLLPGMLGLGVLVNRALAALRHPDPFNISVAVVVVLLLAGLGVLAKRRFGGPGKARR
ncbi:MAG TPA: VTT domain-containing protein [Polyangia bacterium]|nr:VTT domain-containing protein [Polyangia bacterium]